MIDFLVNIGIPKQYAGDIWMLAIFVALGLALIFLVKRKNLGPLLLSVYISYVITSFSFFLPKDVNLKAIYFLVITGAVFWMMRKIFGLNIHGKKIVIWGQTLAIALLIVGMVLSLVLTWIPIKELSEFFTPFSRQLLVSDLARFVWVVLPFAVLVFVKKHRY